MTVHDTAVLAAPLPRSRRHGMGFWFIAASFMVVMAFNAVPTPLYPLYQARDGFSTLTVTVVFAVFAFGVAGSLIFLGHVSDYVGRKKILLPALALELLATIIFLVRPELDGLIVARLLGGVGIGMFTATATAHLHELHASRRPGSGRGLFEIVSTGANFGGLAVGPLIAGALAEYVTEPLRTPYLVFGVLLVMAVAGVAFTPETVEELPVRPAYRPQRVSADHGARGVFLLAAASGFAAFAVNGVYTALSAVFVAGTLGHRSHFLAGVVAFSLLGAATLAQIATSQLSLLTRQRLGVAGEMAGLVLLVVSIGTASLGLFIAAGVVAGAGAGLLFRSAIGTVSSVAAPDRRGEALAGLFLACYAGMSLPAIGVGVAAQLVPVTTAMYVFCAAALLMLAVLGAAVGKRATR